MNFLITINNVCFNVKALGFNDISNKIGYLTSFFPENFDGIIKSHIIRDFNQCGQFRVTFPKKYSNDVYKKLADVVLYEIKKLNY